MCLSRKLLICCVFLLLFLENGVLAAGSSSEHVSCCFQVFANGSAVYRLSSTVESSDTRWNRNKTPIKDEVENVDKNIVIASGQNWITLTNNYSDICFSFQGPEGSHEVHCTDSCESGKSDLLNEKRHETEQSDGGDGGDGGEGGTGLNTASKAGIGAVVLVLVIVISIGSIIWKTKCSRKLGGFRAGAQDDQQETAV